MSLDLWKTDAEIKEENLKNLEWQKNNLEYDLLSADWILEKVRNSDTYAQHLYAALCNNEFIKNEVWPILKEDIWGCTWRYAGGMIADMQEKGDYIEWYCSGIRNDDIPDQEFKELTVEQQEWILQSRAYVSESVVTDEIREDLLKLGWIVIEDELE